MPTDATKGRGVAVSEQRISRPSHVHFAVYPVENLHITVGVNRRLMIQRGLDSRAGFAVRTCDSRDAEVA